MNPLNVEHTIHDVTKRRTIKTLNRDPIRVTNVFHCFDMIEISFVFVFGCCDAPTGAPEDDVVEDVPEEEDPEESTKLSSSYEEE